MNKNIYTSDISSKPQEIIQLLSVFPLLTRLHIQQLLHHKSHRKIFAWLSLLRQRGYVTQLSIKQNNAGFYYLLPSGVKFAKKLSDLQPHKRLSIKNISLLTIDRYLSIADISILLLKDTKKDSLKFFTQVNMAYDFFSITPDAYVTYQEKAYFIELDRETQSINVWKKKFEKYAEYYHTHHWKKLSSLYFPQVCIVSFTQQRANKLVKLVEELFTTSTFAPIIIKFTTLDIILSRGVDENICKVPFKQEAYTFL